MRSNNTPGLKLINRNGTVKPYWIAAQCSRNTKGFQPRTASLAHLPAEEWPQACASYYADLQKWLASEPKRLSAFAGTIASLIDQYTGHELSPYQRVKYNSRENYDTSLRVLRTCCGGSRLDHLTGVDFMYWHEALINPQRQDGERRVERAHAAMSMLRRIFRWGVVLELPECKRLMDIIGEMEFEQVAPRTELLTYDHAVAIIAQAHTCGRASIAFAQALQFELMFRQKDVIGEYLPDRSTSGIRLASKNAIEPRRWDNGLTWSHIDRDMVLRKATTKTGQVAQFDLKLYPLVMAEIAKVPMARRVGPMITNEKTGLPYTANSYRTIWREIANAAGVPSAVQNRDSRAGGITEATDGGAGLELVRHHSTHKNPSMTARYSRNTLKKTAEVARLRVESRERKP